MGWTKAGLGFPVFAWLYFQFDIYGQLHCLQPDGNSEGMYGQLHCLQPYGNWGHLWSTPLPTTRWVTLRAFMVNSIAYNIYNYMGYSEGIYSQLHK